MRRVTRNGVIAVAAASGVMAVAMPAFADSAADGSAAGSPGLISGNGVQLPVDIPVNLCGDTVDVVGLLNPAAGNACANRGSGHGGGGAVNGGGASAQGGAQDSPGVVSGNSLQLPVHLPANVSGNSVNVVGIGNPVFGNTSVNTSQERPPTPGRPTPEPPTRHTPPAASHSDPGPAPAAPAPQAPAPRAVAALAHTGADATLPAAAGAAALVLGGALLYRRSRPAAER